MSASTWQIPIPLQGPPLSAAARFFDRRPSPITPTAETSLLASIRTALRGSGTEPLAEVHAKSYQDPTGVTHELTWDCQTVVASIGGVIRKKWDFRLEDQPVQWACFGQLEQTGPALSSHGSSHYTTEETNATSTFGPFTRAQRKRATQSEHGSYETAVFVFLRNFGRIFLMNGMDYAFSLPFVVRKVWPLHPHGVLIQRVLEPSEVADAEAAGEFTLPTIFSLTSPFAEATAVGLTAGIVGGALKDEDENSTKPLKSIPASESIVWSQDGYAVTVDTNVLTLWRYVYLKPKDIPLPLARRKPAKRIPNEPGTPTPASSLPGLTPMLSTATTMAELMKGELPGIMEANGVSDPKKSKKADGAPKHNRQDSLTRNELSMTMDRMVLGAQMEHEQDRTLAPIEHGRMKAAYWMEKLVTHDLWDEDTAVWSKMTVSLFDQRWDGAHHRSLMAVYLPASQLASIFELTEEGTAKEKSTAINARYRNQIPAIAAIAIRATRTTVDDLLVIEPNHNLVLYMHGLCTLPLSVGSDVSGMDVDGDSKSKLVGLEDALNSSVTLLFADGSKSRITLDLSVRDTLTAQCLRILSLTLPYQDFIDLHRTFLVHWSSAKRRESDDTGFSAFVTALYNVFGVDTLPHVQPSTDSFTALSRSPSHNRFREDPALRKLKLPPNPRGPPAPPPPQKPHRLLAPVLFALHTIAEETRLVNSEYQQVVRLAPVICRIALIIRPEWADYWKRLCPDAMADWPCPSNAAVQYLDDRMPVWPPDLSAMLYATISNPDWKAPSYDCTTLAAIFQIAPSFAFGAVDSLSNVRRLSAIYRRLADPTAPTTQSRAENAIRALMDSGMGTDPLSALPTGIAAPIREAARTCQLSPPGDWPVAAYHLIGRDDLAAGEKPASKALFNDGYRAIKDFINPTNPRKTFNTLIAEANSAGAGEVDAISGVELDLEEFTEIRFGQDRRLEEVARMLCSSKIPSIRMPGRPDLNEHEQAKEQQLGVVRIAERTLALPYGRAMFTFGSVPTITREAYAVPKLEYAVRIQPENVVTAPEMGQIPQECTNWGGFHNGVAAGLRISPSSAGVESSWIAFNKPSELTPEHAGFLFGLGLTGHLKEMLTWHTFSYLTPKHDLTSIGVLLGLAAANIGTGNEHVTKLLAVHTPALLPTPQIDLNVSLMTQAAGLAGLGVLYMGTKDRRRADTCLAQISRKELVQRDLSTEHREAYTFSAALAFGMIMLGKGASIPADLEVLDKLRVLLHGEPKNLTAKQSARPLFDINLTSPAASIALGLMYLRTERRDVADIMTIPDTVLELNLIQPSFLLMRTVARSLIMWDAIKPTNEWLSAQVPATISKAIEARFQGKRADDAMELAYYNILAGCCFAIGLKYAGTARQEAYLMIISYFDLFSRLVYSNVPAFDHKIKRSTVREGLNLISIALCMVMAGTGEITCFRRLRYAYGMYHQAFGYGIHTSTHMSLGLLFLGGGRYTLGTSDAAIACMVMAFFPRFHVKSSDNQCYLQALRHMWVLAAEPRCLIARDVDTNEVVYLPVKITVKEGNEVGTTQLISPTLIPDLDKLMAIRVDTPRYWPFYLDTEHVPRHKLNLIQNQTLYVKRRTAFLSYTEDPRGSRSLFVRSGSSAGDAATLDFPQLTDTKTHPASDLTQFITSFSNDVIFLAFADHFSRDAGETPTEQLFHTYCHAALLDSILQDKTRTLQTHLTLYHYRTMLPTSRFFNLKLQDLRFTADFYSKIYDRRFSGRSENNIRPSLVRENTVVGSLHALDQRLERIRTDPQFISALGQYSRGEPVDVDVSPDAAFYLAWYLLRNGVPASSLLVVLKGLAHDAHAQCSGLPPPDGTPDVARLDLGIKQVLHGTGSKMSTAFGSGWAVRSLDEVIGQWATADRQLF